MFNGFGDAKTLAANDLERLLLEHFTSSQVTHRAWHLRGLHSYVCDARMYYEFNQEVTYPRLSPQLHNEGELHPLAIRPRPQNNFQDGSKHRPQ